ncbi:hypothetical protein HGRIS_010896 [Hohenbuehelia grisea]|uniref:Uncharacterized protein n=1 Tax=Hohenbuehelia grisea TaxID=104357 RepID=A0ABR3IY52_9AGAR
MAYHNVPWLALPTDAIADVQIFGFLLFPILLVLLVLHLVFNRPSVVEFTNQAPVLEETLQSVSGPQKVQESRPSKTLRRPSAHVHARKPRRVVRRAIVRRSRSPRRSIVTPSPSTSQSTTPPPSLLPRPSGGQDPRPSRAFTSFCERLLHVNAVWRRDKELAALQARLDTQKAATRANAFAAFADRLLLQNKVWAKERELLAMQSACAELQRARDAAVSRAAESMVDDLRREALARDLVVGVLGELHDARQALRDTKKAHEREILELHGDWSQDYRKLNREAELLRLAQAARAVEQDVAARSEEALVDSLRESREREVRLEQRVREVELFEAPPTGAAAAGASLAGVDYADDDDDSLNDVSISSTCVSTHSLPFRKASSHGMLPTPLPTPPIDGIGRSLSPPPLDSHLLPTTFDEKQWYSAHTPDMVPSLPYTTNAVAGKRVTLPLPPPPPPAKRASLAMLKTSLWARATRAGVRKAGAGGSARRPVAVSKHHGLCGSPTSASALNAGPFDETMSGGAAKRHRSRVMRGVWRP